ncbi:hypothetical protein Sango_1581700 [Sesamum angolense]|uniref:Aminotransferase-like plant mobile domain-containing protein n=1 Tax=Sesamum angolense TaxID=2727404 RepID=A0AAE1WQ00_9LAMI|nr:hypothetical protein Sango_1581700 [Sesamum angolense]
MQSGMEIFILLENSAIPKDIRSGLRTCLADVEIDCAISKYMMLFMLRCLLMITIPISSKHFVKRGALLQILCLLLSRKCPSRCGICINLSDSLRKMVRSKSTHNPLADIAIHERWSTAEEVLFAKLCIERSLKEEVYLAAYLACWLCVFVPPGNDVNSIRPSTFKMASLMANGRRVNLAIPVLVSIYESLNTFATSPKPADEPFKFVDDGHTEELDHSYFVAIHSSYLTLRQGGRFIIELYNLHDLSVNLGTIKIPKSIKITLKRKKDEDKQVDGGENDPPHALIPPVVIECDSQVAVAEATNFVAELEDEVQSIDVGEESETSHSSIVTPPLGMRLRRKQSPPPIAVSVFKGESFLFNYQKEFLQRLWSGLLMKISNTPVDFLSSIEDDVYLILESMKSFRKFDISKVEESLNTFFCQKVKACLQDVQAKASEEASEIQSAMDEL